MAFPPQKKSPGGSPPPKGTPAKGGPPGPTSGGPPSRGGPPPPPNHAAMPHPGMGVDGMQALFGGPMQAGAPGGPMDGGAPGGQPLGGGGFPPGPDGMPVGATPPDPGASDGGSALLAQLMAGLSGGGGGDPNYPGDPYSVAPGGSEHVLDGLGPDDPNVGLQQLLQQLALAHAGSGPPNAPFQPAMGGAGSSGVGPGQFSLGTGLGF